MKEDRVYLEHTLEAIQRVAAYSPGGWEAFSANQMAQDAVIRNFEIIAIALRSVADETCNPNPAPQTAAGNALAKNPSWLRYSRCSMTQARAVQNSRFGPLRCSSTGRVPPRT